MQIILNFRPKNSMKLLLSFALPGLLILGSCFGKEIKSDLTTKDTVSYPQLIADQLENYYGLKELPFAIDSSFFAADSSMNFDDGNLTVNEVKFLSARMAYDEASSREKHYLNDFYRIAEAKAGGTYENFKEKLDIGMTENATCRSIGRLEFGDTMGLVLWEVMYKSFDACPFYTGHHVLGTLVKDGQAVYCMNLASRESGADAPMSFEMYQLASVSNNAVITIRNHSQAMEDDSLVEQSHVFLKYKITGKGFSVIK